MKKILLFIFFIGLLIVFNLFLSQRKTVRIDSHPFIVDIAQTPQEQGIGLAKYNFISSNQAMYFPFSHPDYYAFWMKDMHFSIDILFLRENKIIDIFPSVPPPQKQQATLPIYKPSSPADAVLEIYAGLSKKYGFKIGDTIELSK